jgi:integrase
METATSLGFPALLPTELEMRYKDLITAMAQEHHANPDPGSRSAWPSRFRNLWYALRAYRRHCNRETENATIGREFGVDFDKHRTAYLQANQAKWSQNTMTDVRSLLQQWQDRYIMMREPDAPSSESAFGDAVLEIMKDRDLSYCKLALEIAVPKSTMHSWINGGRPQQHHSRESVRRLELFAGKATGELQGLFARKSYALSAREADDWVSPYRQRMRAERMAYWRSDDEFPETLKQEFRDLVQYKTKAVKHRWASRPIEEMQAKYVTWANTMTTIAGATVVSPTANIAWSNLRSFFSFATLENGAALAIETLSLALAVDHELVGSYIDFIAERAGGHMHGGCNSFLAFLASLLRKESGYLWLHPEFADKVGKSREQWPELCESAWKAYSEKLSGLINGGDGSSSRDPFLELAHILNQDDPMQFVLDAFAKMQRDLERMPEGSVPRAILGRDYALVTVLYANPLRARQNAAMKWLPKDRNAPLRQMPNGNYGVFLPKRAFKNYRGAKKQDYDNVLSDLASGALHDYINTYRPILLTVRDGLGQPLLDEHGNKQVIESDILFVSSRSTKDRAKPWDHYNQRVAQVTKRYFGNNFGPHSFRDLVATIYLKEHPEDFYTVSRLLHDDLSTVIAHYDKNKTSTSFQRWHKDVDGRGKGIVTARRG